MQIQDYKLILDSLHTIGVYVIREDNHQLLYFNNRVQEVASHIELGMVCSEAWGGSCGNCPLHYIEGKEEAHSTNFNDAFGEVVDITAARILWKGETPAFVITVSPHTETVSHTYNRILRANLTTDSFEVVRSNRAEVQKNKHFSSLREWITQFVENGNVYERDEERFRAFMRVEYMSQELKQNKKMLVCTYRRKVEQGYRWYTIEVVPDTDYTDENQSIMLYVKDVHDIYREGLEQEEANIQNQEIIKSLGEMNFGVYIIDLQTAMLNPVRMSPDMEEMLRTGLQEWDIILRKMLDAYFHPDYREKLYKALNTASLRELQKKGEAKIELLCQRLINGEYRYVTVTATIHENNIDPYVILSLQDIDERVRQEIRQSQNDKQMAAILRSGYSIMNTVYLDTGVCERIYLNRGEETAQVHSGDYEYYIQKALKETVFEEDVETFAKYLTLENLRKKAETVEDFAEVVCQYRLAKPTAMWVEDHIFFVRQEDTVMVNILGRDITRQKLREAEEERDKKDRDYIISCLSRLFFAIYYMDMESYTYRMVSQRQAVGEVLGDTANGLEAFESYAQHFVHPDDRKGYLEMMNYQNLRNVLNDEHPFISTEYRMIHTNEDGSFTNDGWVRASVILANMKNGAPKHVLYVAQDITEVKRKEEQEHQAMKDAYEIATQANAAKSDFLSKMSHDIRTPMNAIIGMTAIAGAHLDDRERILDCLNKITISSKHLLALINEVLDMSKIESGKIDLSEDEFNLSDLIQNLQVMIRPAVQNKQHELEFRITKVEHEDLVGDVLRLQQVFMNMLSNSVKYTPPGGKLEVEITEKPSNIFGYCYYEFVFKDNGIGMSQKFLEQIFEPFSRAEDSRVSKIEGTGLGTTIAANIVHMMNGNITVESKEGEGSKFTVSVFLKQQNTEASNITQLISLPVLVVDDDAIACEAACTILDDIGLKSEWVLSGKEAVQRIQQTNQTGEDFFAVILDWKMPEMDGIQTAKAIRQEVGPDVPIIILTAYDWSNIEAEARAAGVNEFISKPLFKSRLVYLFRKLVGEEKKEESLASAASTEMDFQGRRILLVEDNELNREIAEEIIGSTGIQVESAGDGKQALDRFMEVEEDYYDLILMDIQMPVMNGYEATKAIRKVERADATRIPIIAMTANAFTEDVIASKEAGMNEHITKPLNIDQLMDCMARWFEKSVREGVTS